MRITMVIVLALILTSAFANALAASGFNDATGLDPEPGGEQHIEDTNETAASISGQNSGGGTLFGLFGAIASVFNNIVGIVFAGPLMLYNIGVPEWILNFVFSVAAVLVGADVIYVWTGRSIT